jgi:2-polyprenyl-6-methoxyphenol hydroxylase-like FAD-dependent oxidoreductase
VQQQDHILAKLGILKSSVLSGDYFTKKKRMKIMIIGAGIAGLTTALALKKHGIETIIFEAAPQIRPIGAGLGLGSNALDAFGCLNLLEKIVQAGRFLPSFTIYDQYGKSITKTNMHASSSFQNFTIHRAALQELLIDCLDETQIQLAKQAIGVEQTKDDVTVQFTDGTSFTADLLLVADGIHSVIRNKLIPSVQLRYAGYTCWRAVISNENLNIQETSETWGTNGRFGIVPLSNNQLYWFACINASQDDPKMKKIRIQDLREQFKNYHDPIPMILSCSTNKQLIWNDIYDLEPLSQFSFDRILLLGDAAHATTPNMGQGACQAIEDAIVIAQCLAKEDGYRNAFEAYQRRRIPRTKWITETSWQIGKLAQLEGKVITSIRNFLLRLIPASINEKQLKKLASVDFIKDRD